MFHKAFCGSIIHNVERSYLLLICRAVVLIDLP